MTGYPAEPWDLRGQLRSSVFLVPRAEVPDDLPPGCHPVRIGRYAVVGTAWASYEPGGVLAYRELMAALLVRRGWRLLPTITHIWVDSAASRDGGRALWGIPKDLATFAFGGGDYAAADDAGTIAHGSVRPRLWLPGRWPVRFHVGQQLDGTAKLSPVRVRARLGITHASFAADPNGPLAFLVGRRPLLSVALGDFRMSFGRR
jgi:hypothetical protein